MSSPNIFFTRLKLLAALLIVSLITGLGWYYRSNFENYADSESDTQTQTLKETVNQLNQEMVNLRLPKVTLLSNTLVTSISSQDLDQTAAKRKAAMLKLLKSNPDSFILSSMPDSLRNEYPKEIQSNIEKHVKLEGKVEVRYTDDFENKTSSTTYWLKTEDNTRYQIYPTKENINNLSGAKVSVNGIILENNLAVDNTSSENLSIITAATPTPKIHKTAAIMINFAANTIRPITTEQVRTQINYVARFYREVSFGKIDFKGITNPTIDVFGWYTMPPDIPCDWDHLDEFTMEAIGVAERDGYGLHKYDNTVFLIAGGNGFAISIAGGPNPGLAWISATDMVEPGRLEHVAHEFGHMLGFGHANILDCGDRMIGGSCEESIYGDIFDVMGAMFRHPNAHYKNQDGWLDPTNVKTILTSGTYTYTIAPIEKPSTGIQLIKIPRVDANGFITDYLGLEFRQPYGYDNFTYTGEVVNGVLIRLLPALEYNWDGRIDTRLLDTTPESNDKVNEILDYWDAALTAGKTFTDSEQGITIKTLSVSPSGVTVQITMTPRGCMHYSPGLEVTPQPSTPIAAGQSINYSIKVTNKDTSECSSSTFEVYDYVGIPLARKVLSPSKVVLAPGASAMVNLAIATPVNTADGSYDAIITAYNIDARGPVTRKETAFWVLSPKDILIGKNASKTNPKHGDWMTYSIGIKNNSANTVNNIMISDPLPSGTHYINNSADYGGSYNASTNTISWTIGSLAPGATRTVTFRVTVD